MDNIIEFLDKVAPILYVFIPAMLGIYLKLKEKLKIKKDNFEKQSLQKRKELYERWIQDESRETIKKVRDLCNLYKDKMNVDLVQYLQLENGTVATSKLHNMFVSCLAEDSRFGKLPKLITGIQRVPYNNFIDFIGEIDSTEHGSYIGYCSKVKIELPDKPFLSKEIKSYMHISIKDRHNNIIGVGVFCFASENFNGVDINEQKSYLLQFRAGAEVLFYDFLMNRDRKRRELVLEESDIK